MGGFVGHRLPVMLRQCILGIALGYGDFSDHDTRRGSTRCWPPCAGARICWAGSEVASLYLHRWEIEVRFRDIKTTLGMEMPSTMSPGMVVREIPMHMIFYSLVRLLMRKVGVTRGVNHRRLSFRGVQ